MTLRRGITTFCLIDFSSEQGKEKLDAAIDTITDLIFAQIEHYEKQVTMANEMDKDGILHKNICKYMGFFFFIKDIDFRQGSYPFFG